MFNLFSALTGATDNTLLSKVIEDGAVLVDVRTPPEFASGSVKGAINIPLDKIGNENSQLKNKKNIVVFCRSGARSGQAKGILEKKGFTNVHNGGTWNNVSKIVR